MNRLDQHERIALDMDQTLVGGLHSPGLRAYVAQHRGIKRFYIITFRHEAWAGKIPEELAQCGLDPRLIQDIVWCPDTLIAGATLHYERDILTPELLKQRAAKQGLDIDTLESLSGQYSEWKGRMAAQLGCSVLVDDAPEMVHRGCEKYGIAFLDVADLKMKE